MRLLIIVLLLLTVGAFQTYLAHLFNLHQGLQHMVYTHWYEYVVEALFYSFFWCIVSSLFKQRGNYASTN
jgi:hypothetical protein